MEPDATYWAAWERRFRTFLEGRLKDGDGAHDLAHVRRVVASARQLAAEEAAPLEVVLPAAWLHDCVVVSKDDPERDQASLKAARAAGVFLRHEGYPVERIAEIEHAVAAHSFSAGIVPRTLAAKVVQDADRLDALGAIGIARCFIVSGSLGSSLYHPDEIFPERRSPDDRRYAVDHFFVKLLRLSETMQTESGRAEARRRAAFMEGYLAQLSREVRVGRSAG